MSEPQPPSPAEIVELLRRDLAGILDQLPPDTESALYFEPAIEGEQDDCN